ncbi:transcriptional regulator [Rothia mucilaginosa]|uniref:transcriptional regulator n=1 Tax=Rothia mucilaginosa TaxID=43675 RepID=UPI0028DD369C|nr:transcriptional regulator [Rothia mucilaginosa]
MEDNTPDFDALHKYLVDNSSEVFTPLIEAEDDEKRRFYLALQTYSLQQKQRIVLADENFVV